MSDKKSEFKDREIEEVDLENLSGGTILTRVETPEEVSALRKQGYTVVKDLFTGHFLAVDWNRG